MDISSLAPKIINVTSTLVSKVTPGNIAWPITDRIQAFFKNRFAAKPRIQMLDVVQLASSKFKWRIADDSLDILDLSNGIRQAAIDGGLQLYGRRSASGNFGSMIDYHPIVAIPADHLIENWVDLISFQRGDNTSMRTYPPAHMGRECFFDLHLDHRQALTWLRTTGREWKGRSNKRKATPFNQRS